MLGWLEPASFIKGATPSVRRAWAELGIETVEDFFLTMPRRYDDFSKSVEIASVQNGDVVTVKGKILKASKLPSFRKRFQIIRASIADQSGKLSATFFNQPWLLEEFTPDREVVFSGKITLHPRYGISMSNPIWEPTTQETVAAGKIAPVYPLTGSLAQKTYRRLIQTALGQVVWPEDCPEFVEAIKQVHQPATLEEAEQGRRVLATDELLVYQLAMRQAGERMDTAGSIPMPFDQIGAKAFVAGLPFPLTSDQKRASWACLQDMAESRPMRRLLLGDVGSGKTVVAAFLAAMTHRAGHSCALLVPTDVLAKQHLVTLRRFLKPHRVPILLMTRTQKTLMDEDEQILTASKAVERIQKGHLVVIGTHALLEANRLPPDLALAIVDEQHRFGVDQREALSAAVRPDGKAPHFLSMTATPIPRSLALTFYGDLAVSSLREKPAGRLPIVTLVVLGEQREDAYDAIRAAVARKERVFIVCPLIDPSDALGVRAATDEAARLSKGPLNGIPIGILHGRMKPAEKDEVMERFINGALDVLVATSVIEVGVDVPDATIMAIEGAERFGLAQLHQLRGRVGRSSKPSACFLMTDAFGAPLDRLRIVERIQDGFALAEADLTLRGSGNLLGTSQSGLPSFSAARPTDLDLMRTAKETAERLLNEDPELASHPRLAQRVQRLRTTAHLE